MPRARAVYTTAARAPSLDAVTPRAALFAGAAFE